MNLDQEEMQQKWTRNKWNAQSIGKCDLIFSWLAGAWFDLKTEKAFWECPIRFQILSAAASGRRIFEPRVLRSEKRSFPMSSRLSWTSSSESLGQKKELLGNCRSFNNVIEERFPLRFIQVCFESGNCRRAAFHLTWNRLEDKWLEPVYLVVEMISLKKKEIIFENIM